MNQSTGHLHIKGARLVKTLQSNKMKFISQFIIMAFMIYNIQSIFFQTFQKSVLILQVSQTDKINGFVAKNNSP